MQVLTPAEARQLWPKLAPAIMQALSRNGAPSVSLLMELPRAIFAGNAKVLVGGDGFGVVFIDGQVCNLLAYNGTLKEIKLLKDAFVNLARSAGCTSIRITGDPAWMRVVPGLRQRAVVMEMAIPSQSP